MNEADILNQLRIIAREHTIKIVEGHMEETMPASVVNELRLNNFSAKILLDYITNLQNRLQQKENIIKEVREQIIEIIDYIYQHGFYYDSDEGAVPNELGMYEIAHITGELKKLINDKENKQ